MENEQQAQPEEELTVEQRIQKLEEVIKKAQQEGDEQYVNYLQRNRDIIIHNYKGGIINFQSGEPQNPPPYGGGG